MKVLESSFPDNPKERRTEPRLTTVLPVLELEGKRCKLIDFSSSGFRALVPIQYRVLGSTGHAVLHIQAAGYTVRKHLKFEVMHVFGSEIGVKYETLDTEVETAGALF